MSIEIRDEYISLLEMIAVKRKNYPFPKACAQLLSNPSDSSSILLNRVYRDFVNEIPGALELISIDLANILTPPVVTSKMDVVDSGEVVFESGSLDKEVLKNILDLPGARLVSDEIFITAHPSTIPYLRSLVKSFDPEISENALIKLKSLSSISEETEKALAFVSIKDGKIYLKLRFPYLKITNMLAKYSTTPTIFNALEYSFPIGLKDSVIETLNQNEVATIFSTSLESTVSKFEPIEYSGNVNELSKLSITLLKGIKEKRAQKFSQYGITNLFSLLFTLPRRYIDRSSPILIKSIREGEEVAFIAKVDKITMDYPKKMLRIILIDSSGRITATFFNSSWMARKFTVGEQVLVYGKADGWGSSAYRKTSLVNPTIEKFENISAPIIPIYPQSQKAGVSSGEIYNMITQTLDRIPNLFDPIDKHINNDLDIFSALKKIHKPLSMGDIEKARSYFIEVELTKLQLFLLLQKHWKSNQLGTQQSLAELDNIIDTFPYSLTNAQSKTILQIREDLESAHPMNRLLQGDVGSGKTLVAAAGIFSLLLSGKGSQAALMAPTEILATQLYNDMQDFAAAYSNKFALPKIRVELFTSRLKPKAKAELYAELASGEIQLAVGTHALIAGKIEFANLGLVIIDEQHRFGVTQRASLSEKSKSGFNPDLLIMTATPIPRTAALTVFGSVDISTLDELPPGRTPIETTWIKKNVELDNVLAEPWKTVSSEVKSGRQAYIVCPLIEENPDLELQSAQETYESLRLGALKEFKLGLVHGQQNAAEREEIMNLFKAGEIDILVSTTVIEVGVNIPNASIIVILDAERFGISQLHQLRGRVGRGIHSSKCFLVSQATGETSKERLTALVESTDGFYLSDIDLKLRGHGQLFGDAQSGISDLQIADLDRDSAYLSKARQIAENLQKDLSPEELLTLISNEKKLDNIFRA
jgi:ATP-dependent DNA helicase RecG